MLRLINYPGTFIPVALGLIILASALAAQEENLPEEIVIEGDRNQINFKRLVDQAEDEFYAILNGLLDDEELHITCENIKVTGSLISQRVCQARYMRDELTSAAMFNFIGVDYVANATLAEKNNELRLKTLELLENNPELRRAALNLSQRVEEYRDEYGIESDTD